MSHLSIYNDSNFTQTTAQDIHNEFTEQEEDQDESPETSMSQGDEHMETINNDEFTLIKVKQNKKYQRTSNIKLNLMKLRSAERSPNMEWNMTQMSGQSETKVDSKQNFRTKSLASVIEVNEPKQTILFKVNLDNEKPNDRDSENLSDSDSHISDENIAHGLIDHQRFKSVNLPHNATVGQYSNIQSSEKFKKEKQTTEHFQSVMNLKQLMQTIKSNKQYLSANQTITSLFDQDFEDFNNMIIDNNIMEKYSIAQLESELQNKKDAISNIIMQLNQTIFYINTQVQNSIYLKNLMSLFNHYIYVYVGLVTNYQQVHKQVNNDQVRESYLRHREKMQQFMKINDSKQVQNDSTKNKGYRSQSHKRNSDQQLIGVKYQTPFVKRKNNLSTKDELMCRSGTAHSDNIF